MDLVPGETAYVTLILMGRRIRGRVLDQATGEPVSDATVRLGERGARRRVRTSTDANGQFDVMLKALSVHKLLDVYHEHYMPGSLALRGGSETVELWLSPRPRFHGVLLHRRKSKGDANLKGCSFGGLKPLEVGGAIQIGTGPEGVVQISAA